MREFRKGRTNLSATIFVPYDCDNNCPFCTSKADYKDMSGFDLIKIVNTIERLNRNKLIQEYVITGGEPFADIFSLSYIINHCEKPVYINTTLPKHNLDNCIQYINNERKIKGINVSRHMNFNFDCVASIEEMDRVEKPIRINSVIPGNGLNELALEKFVERYGKKKRDINLRANFKTMTPTGLKVMNQISALLSHKYDYISTESCMVCNSEYFSVNDKFIVSYHRGLEHSSVTFGNKTYVNDVIVKPDGNTYSDWDCVNDEEFNEWVFKRF